jgi:hypothetical protein
MKREKIQETTPDGAPVLTLDLDKWKLLSPKKGLKLLALDRL